MMIQLKNSLDHCLLDYRTIVQGEKEGLECLLKNMGPLISTNASGIYDKKGIELFILV